MLIISSIAARVFQLLRNHWKGAATFIVSAAATGIIGEFAYDSLKSLGNPATPTVVVAAIGQSGGSDVGKSSPPTEGDGKPVVSDEQRRAEAAEKRRAMLAELFGTDAYRPGATLIAVRAERESPTSQAAARAVAGALAKHFEREGRLAVEVQPVFAKSPDFNELMDGSLQSLREAGLDKKLRTAIFAMVDASCESGTSMAGIVRCTINIQMRAVDGQLQFVVSGPWPGKGSGTNERDALALAVERVFEEHAAQLKRL